MHLQILSDLHLETHPHFRAQPAPGAELLVLAGAVSAASLVVSGSVVVVGELVYWLEAKGRCLTVPGF